VLDLAQKAVMVSAKASYTCAEHCQDIAVHLLWLSSISRRGRDCLASFASDAVLNVSSIGCEHLTGHSLHGSRAVNQDVEHGGMSCHHCAAPDGPTLSRTAIVCCLAHTGSDL
jgi:hypothetical protein